MQSSSRGANGALKVVTLSKEHLGRELRTVTVCQSFRIVIANALQLITPIVTSPAGGDTFTYLGKINE